MRNAIKFMIDLKIDFCSDLMPTGPHLGPQILKTEPSWAQNLTKDYERASKNEPLCALLFDEFLNGFNRFLADVGARAGPKILKKRLLPK